MLLEHLYHISEEAGITSFLPRPAPPHAVHAGEQLVWAIDDTHLHNYLLPRDCPRVTFYAHARSTAEDIERFLGHSQARYIVVIESAWYERLKTTPLYLYNLPRQNFRCFDEGAGYHVSQKPVRPLSCTRIDDPLAMMLDRSVELRITPSLWPLRDAVIASSLQFSCIRMRHATAPS